MSEQPDLWGNESSTYTGLGYLGLLPALARASDPYTSHAAAKSITPGSSEGRILDALRFGPLTDEELGQVLYPSLPATIATARSRLSKAAPPKVVAVGSKLNSRRREVLVWGLA